MASVAFSKNATWFATGLRALRELIARFCGPDFFFTKQKVAFCESYFTKKIQGQDSVRTWNLGFLSLPETVLPSCMLPCIVLCFQRDFVVT